MGYQTVAVTDVNVNTSPIIPVRRPPIPTPRSAAAPLASSHFDAVAHFPRNCGRLALECDSFQGTAGSGLGGPAPLGGRGHELACEGLNSDLTESRGVATLSEVRSSGRRRYSVNLGGTEHGT